jgi:acyl-CoA thioester hydrolase
MTAIAQPPSISQPSDASRPRPQARSAFAHFERLGTRWMDNDIYGHLNNVVYYSLIDSAVNQYLIGAGALDIHAGAVIGLVVETHCNFFAPLAFPQRIDAGIRIGRSGRSSVRYEIGLFAEGAELSAAAGHFVHVYVDRQTRRPVAQLPPAYLNALQGLRS